MRRPGIERRANLRGAQHSFATAPRISTTPGHRIMPIPLPCVLHTATPSSAWGFHHLPWLAGALFSNTYSSISRVAVATLRDCRMCTPCRSQIAWYSAYMPGKCAQPTDGIAWCSDCAFKPAASAVTTALSTE
eukprot:5908021-Prymnesium_polylepis.1